MRFYDADTALKYAYGVECWSFYGESILADYIRSTGEGWWVSSGMNKHDHLLYSAKIAQIAREHLQQDLFHLVEAKYIVPSVERTSYEDRHRLNRKIKCCGELLEWCPPIVDSDEYIMDQVRKWVELPPMKLQKDWAQELEMSTRALSSRNKPLLEWLEAELDRAHNALTDVFTEFSII